MDANNTKYHLLHGERDWLPVLVNQLSNDIWWDRERKSISLSPIVQQLSELKGCSLCMMLVSNDNEQQQKVKAFKIEFESKKQECAVLIVNSTSAPDKWKIAGFDDAGIFNEQLIDDPRDELSVELKKEPPNKSKIIELVTSRLGRTRKLLTQEQRRGAAYDHYGNIYWINAARNGIDYHPAATPLQLRQFWHIDELKRASQIDKNHGDFKPIQQSENLSEPILSGLAVTTHEYLVVGTLQPAGLLVFDLHAGGPPEWLCCTEQIPFAT